MMHCTGNEATCVDCDVQGMPMYIAVATMPHDGVRQCEWLQQASPWGNELLVAALETYQKISHAPNNDIVHAENSKSFMYIP
jgi:hypothetical protein